MNIFRFCKTCALVTIAFVAIADTASATPVTTRQAAAYAKPIFVNSFNATGLGPRTRPSEVEVSCRPVRNQVDTFTCRGKRRDNYCNGTMTVYKTRQQGYKHKNNNSGCVAS